jgi:uncharacterized protein YcnI
MNTKRLSVMTVVALGATLVLAAGASAHARVSPAVSVSGQLQLYSLAVPTEKSGLTTSKIVLTVPTGFGIDSFVPPPTGWHQSTQQSGSGDSAVVEKVTWTGGHTPTAQDSLFQFLAQPASTGTYRFTVQQTYSDGSIVNWADAENGADPAPTISVKSSLGGGGTSILTIVALILGTLGVLAGGVALVGGGGREGGGGRPLA